MSSAPKSQARLRRAVILVHLGFVLTGVVTTMLGPILPALTQLWQLDDARAGRLFTLQFCFSVLGTLMCSRVMGRVGSRGAMFAGLAIMSAGVAILAAGFWPAALVGICAYGVGLGLSIPATNLLIAAAYPERRASALSALNLAWSVGAVLAPPAFACFMRRHSLSAVLTLLAGLLLVVLVCLVSSGRSEFIATNNGGNSGAIGAPRRDVVLMLSLLLILYVGTETAVGGWLSTYSQRIGFSSLAAASIAQSIFWAALLIGRAAAPVLLRWQRTRDFVLMSLTSALAGILVVVTSSHYALITAGAFLAGLGLAGIYPSIIAVLTGAYGSAAERRMGTVFATVGIGGAILPWLVGMVSKQFQSLRLGMALCGVSVVLMILLAFASWSRGLEPDPSESAPK